MGEKKVAEAYILGIPFGLFGAHHFYLKRKTFGIVYACTLGLFGIGYLFDLIRMKWLVRHANRYGTEKKMVSDCYLICFLSGLFGGHHFYLGNKKLGIFYACTLGVFTIGWIVDLIRMKYLVEAYNSKTDEKSLGTAYILALSPFGIFGAHHYYLGNVKLGLIYTFTVGTFGIGWIVDLFRMPKLVKKAGMDVRSVGTAYIMAAPPFGFFGAHHYYLENYGLGIVYTCTLGVFGIGWVVDLFRMKGLVKASNDQTSDHGMTKITAYMLCVSPLGLFGAHHFYLKRYLNGGFYVATIGLFGFGWIFDMLRLPVLYERYANEDKHKYVDEAYIFWFPFGLFGLHHFYMENKRWGILYACTFGCLGIGWVIDGLRLPSMIRDYNGKVEDPDLVEFRICRPSCKACSVTKCRRCCFSMFSSCCECCENFSLPRSSSKSRRSERDLENRNENAQNEELRAMKESDNSLNGGQGLNSLATVQTDYNMGYDKGDANAEPAYDNGAYPGEAGYGVNSYDQEVAAGNNVAYPPPYDPTQAGAAHETNQYQGQYAENNQTQNEQYNTEGYAEHNQDAAIGAADESYYDDSYYDDSEWDDVSQSVATHEDVKVAVTDGQNMTQGQVQGHPTYQAQSADSNVHL